MPPGERYSSDYRHFDHMIWQVPSWASAIGVGALLAVLQGLAADSNPMALTVQRCIFAAAGAFIMVALAVLHAYRVHQRAAAEGTIFRKKPSRGRIQAQVLLRLFLAGLAAVHFSLLAWSFDLSPAAAVIAGAGLPALQVILQTAFFRQQWKHVLDSYTKEG